MSDEENQDTIQNPVVEDPHVYEDINDKMQKNELEIVGVDQQIKDALKKRVEEKVEELKVGHKVKSDLDPEVYE